MTTPENGRLGQRILAQSGIQVILESLIPLFLATLDTRQDLDYLLTEIRSAAADVPGRGATTPGLSNAEMESVQIVLEILADAIEDQFRP